VKLELLLLLVNL